VSGLSSTREELTQLIKKARQLVVEAIVRAEYPALQKALKDADTMLHWSLWQLGEVEDLNPRYPSKAEGGSST